jgi:hypothetical protein
VAIELTCDLFACFHILAHALQRPLSIVDAHFLPPRPMAHSLPLTLATLYHGFVGSLLLTTTHHYFTLKISPSTIRYSPMFSTSHWPQLVPTSLPSPTSATFPRPYNRNLPALGCALL